MQLEETTKLLIESQHQLTKLNQEKTELEANATFLSFLLCILLIAFVVLVTGVDKFKIVFLKACSQI